MTPRFAQIALCTTDVPRSVQPYTEVFGFADAGGKALWGADRADAGPWRRHRLRFLVARRAAGGDIYLEVVSYSEPAGRPHPDDHLLSDRGFMNTALGYREPEAVAATHERAIANGYHDNFQVPESTGGTYLNDDQGNTLELLLVARELDPDLGCAPQPLFRPTLAWPQPSVGPAGSSAGA